MNNKQLERFKKLDTNALSNVSGQGYGAGMCYWYYRNDDCR